MRSKWWRIRQPLRPIPPARPTLAHPCEIFAKGQPPKWDDAVYHLDAAYFAGSTITGGTGLMKARRPAAEATP